MIEKYIPSGEYGARVAAILKPYEGYLYAIGSNGRNKAYDLKSNVTGYDFLVDGPEAIDIVVDHLNEAFPGDVKVDETAPVVYCDCETFDLKLRFQRLGDFLRQVTFAGDMLAVAVADGALICCPEFMTVPPMIQVRKLEENAAQNNPEWQDKHKLVLQTFHDDIVKSISNAKEPAST